jgi:hypothetical protein
VILTAFSTGISFSSSDIWGSLSAMQSILSCPHLLNHQSKFSWTDPNPFDSCCSVAGCQDKSTLKQNCVQQAENFKVVQVFLRLLDHLIYTYQVYVQGGGGGIWKLFQSKTSFKIQHCCFKDFRISKFLYTDVSWFGTSSNL